MLESAATTWLNSAAMGIDLCTGAAILLGVGLGLVRMAREAVSSGEPEFRHTLRRVRLTIGQWLAFALELALAADILRTVVVPTWDEIGKLGAIVVLRTTLNLFLSKEIAEADDRRTHGPAPSAA